MHNVDRRSNEMEACHEIGIRHQGQSRAEEPVTFDQLIQQDENLNGKPQQDHGHIETYENSKEMEGDVYKDSKRYREEFSNMIPWRGRSEERRIILYD